MFNDLTPDEIFPYAPPQGIEELRDLWQQKMLCDNQTYQSTTCRPIVTNALTHGLSLVGDLFVNQGDTILLPEHTGVITNLFSIREMVQTFKHILSLIKTGIYLDSLVALQSYNKDKVIMILNYPNNPTGYTPTHKEVTTIVDAIKALADKGTKVIAVVDDAYYGLFYEDVYTQSLFTAN